MYKKEKREMLARVPQGSVLGPSLWNTFFTVWIMDVFITASADDIVLSIVATKIEELNSTANRTLAMISKWMGDNRLVDDKSEVQIMKERRNRDLVTIKLGNKE